MQRVAPVEHEVSAAFPRPLASLAWPEVRGQLDGLDQGCAALMRSEGVPPERCQILYFADICYVGQSYHLEIPLTPASGDPLGDAYRDFRVAHDRVYGHSTDAPARIVNLRSIHRSAAAATKPAPYSPDGTADRKGERRILTGEGGALTATIYRRAALASGAILDGPAIVEQADTTTLIEPGWRGTVAPNGTLILTAH